MSLVLVLFTENVSKLVHTYIVIYYSIALVVRID